MDCLICFYPITGSSVTCGNPDCDSRICTECATAFVNFSDKQIPKCPNTSCKHEYLYSEMKKLDVVKRYNNICYEFFNIDKGNDATELLSHEIMIEKLRKERKEFIQAKFPAAIALTIEYALASKMRKIDKENKKKIQKVVESSNKKCMNLLCPGKLDPNYVCMTCESHFCKECEKKKTDTHTCDPNDIESVKFVDSLVKCPKCVFPVIRSWGCNFMTCSVCKTNFHYETGEITNAGNHHDITTTLKQNNKPSVRYVGEYPADIMELIIRIEDMIPKTETLQPIIKLLTKITKHNDGNSTTSDVDTYKENIAKHFEKYKMYQHKNKKYYKIMQTIEEHHVQKTLTKEKLILFTNILL